MGTVHRRELQPRDIVWFKTPGSYGTAFRGTVTNKPFYYKGVKHVELLYRDDDEDQMIAIPIADVSHPVNVVPPPKVKRTKVEIFKNILKEIKVKLSKPAIVTGIIIAFVAILGLWLAGNYNSLVVANNSVNNSKAKIDTQLERRYELIDNIVESVKGSQAQESDVFGQIAAARKIGGSATSESAEAAANNTIDTQIALLPRLQESYPELRSNEQVTRLITELQGTAGQVATARDTYNDTVTNYNNNIASFPKNVFANIFGFKSAELFKVSDEAKSNPKVDLNRE